jgi:hypothetical protein
MIEPAPGNRQVACLALDANELPALQYRRTAGGAAAGERVEDNAAGRRGQCDQPAHQRERLYGWMDVGPRMRQAASTAGEDRLRAVRQPFAAGVTLGPVRLGGVEQAAQAALRSVRSEPVDQPAGAVRLTTATVRPTVQAAGRVGKQQVARPVPLTGRPSARGSRVASTLSPPVP